MNFGMNAAPFFIILLWITGWIVALYLVVRFLGAFERMADAHERIANALNKQ